VKSRKQNPNQIAAVFPVAGVVLVAGVLVRVGIVVATAVHPVADLAIKRITEMYIHEEIQLAVLPLIDKYDLELIELIGEINHAIWEMSVLNKTGIQKLKASLEKDSAK
jgi:hypothetical protein